MHHVYETFLRNRGYEFLTEYRYGIDACLVGFKTEKFELLDSLGVQHNDMAKHLGEKLLARSNAGLILKLKQKADGRELIVASTHLHWNI